jgi:hypothetical protein
MAAVSDKMITKGLTQHVFLFSADDVDQVE